MTITLIFYKCRKFRIYFLRYRVIAVQAERIVITSKRITQIADNVASNVTVSVAPSDSNVITATDNRATMECARINSFWYSLVFLFFIDLNIGIFTLLSIYDISRLMRLWLVVNPRASFHSSCPIKKRPWRAFVIFCCLLEG